MNVNYNSASESSVAVDPLERTESGDGTLAFGPNDVLSGRNKLSFNHIGNRRFREVVAQSIDDYNSAQSRAEKYGIVETIMSHIAKSGGRFLKQADDGSWQELEPETVRQKIAHAIRDTTKKKEAKAKKALQREISANKMQGVFSQTPATVTQGSRGTSSQKTAPIDYFVQDLDKYLKKNPNVSARLTTPAEAKDIKPQSVESAQLSSRQALGLSPHSFKPELRHEPAEDMKPFEIEMRRDLGHRLRHSPPLGPETPISYGQRPTRPASAPGASQMYGHHSDHLSACLQEPVTSLMGLGMGLREQMVASRQQSLGLGFREQMAQVYQRQHSLPDLRAGQDFGLGMQHHLRRDVESFSEPSMMGHQLVHQMQDEPIQHEEPIEPEDPIEAEEPPVVYEDAPVAHDDEFMAKIDDTLGPWHPSEPDSKI